MATKSEWKLATQLSRCPWCEGQGQIVQTKSNGEYATAYTFSCNCRGKNEYYEFTVIKKPNTPPFIRFKMLKASDNK